MGELPIRVLPDWAASVCDMHSPAGTYRGRAAAKSMGPELRLCAPCFDKLKALIDERDGKGYPVKNLQDAGS